MNAAATNENRGLTATAPETRRAHDLSLRVVVADDHDLTRRALARVLSSADGIVVVGEAADGEEAVRLTGALHPDVVLMDIRMPHVDGFEALRRIRAAGETSVVLCSSYRDRQYSEEALRLGAAGFVPKSSDEATIIGAVLEAARATDAPARRSPGRRAEADDPAADSRHDAANA